jgi:hypothetical protein
MKEKSNKSWIIFIPIILFVISFIIFSVGILKVIIYGIDEVSDLRLFFYTLEFIILISTIFICYTIKMCIIKK